jgi:hypothetical protein
MHKIIGTVIIIRIFLNKNHRRYLKPNIINFIPAKHRTSKLFLAHINLKNNVKENYLKIKESITLFNLDKFKHKYLAYQALKPHFE